MSHVSTIIFRYSAAGRAHGYTEAFRGFRGAGAFFSSIHVGEIQFLQQCHCDVTDSSDRLT